MLGTIGLPTIGACLLALALGVVLSRDLVHSVFWLAGALLATAVLYVALDAPFLATIQVLLYTGGVITLMLFGVMLSLRDPGAEVPNPAMRRPAGAAVAALIASVLLWAIWSTPELAAMTPVAAGDGEEIGRLFLDRYLLAFEALSVLLLAGMIGAIVLARRTDA